MVQGGYAHVVDDETNFSTAFGRNVIAGMLDLPPEDAHRRPRVETPQMQREAVKAFLKDWERHDWTKMLD